MFEVDPQPRIDVLCEDGATRDPRRLTAYSGVAWYGGRIDIAGSVTVFRYDLVDGAFFLPDSLPYDPAHVARVQVSTSLGVQASGRDAFRVVGGASLVPDPEGRPMAWVQLHVTGRTSVPVGLSYRVELLGPPQMVLPPER